MAMVMPPGTVEFAGHYPFVVMRDRVGWFVYEMGVPLRHYCRNRRDAIKAAAVWQLANN